MPLAVCDHAEENVVDVKAVGKLTKEEYREFVREWEQLIEDRGRVRVVFDVHELRGWEPRVMWEDFKFGLRHGRDIKRLALVGGRPWQQWLGRLCRVFVCAPVRYFDRSRADEAMSWVTAQ